MAQPPEVTNMALFCDFENIALGVRDARYEKFDIGKVLERLLLKGSIVVKKAYCDWERYKAFKAPMHEASFELIEIPHVRQSGKNSADIRMVVDALDLCYTKSHVETFVIISGDSDFSPLVSKLRENNKVVIGVGVKNSTSDLLIANCDEFIYYDDLVREKKKAAPRRAPAKAAAAANTKPAPKAAAGEPSSPPKKGDDERTQEALELILGTIEALVAERGRRGEDLGLDGQAGLEAPQAGLQRVLLRLPLVQRDARRGGASRQPQARARREVGRLHRPAAGGRRLGADRACRAGATPGWVPGLQCGSGRREPVHAVESRVRAPIFVFMTAYVHKG